MINRACARLLFRDSDPIGREVSFLHEPIDLTGVPQLLADQLKVIRTGDSTWRVIGVVDNVRMSGTSAADRPSVYVEYRQQDEGFWFGSLRPMLVVRTRPEAGPGLDRATGLIRKQFSSVRINEAVTMQDLMERATGTQGSRVLLSSSAALLSMIAVVLVGAGVYALFSEMISRRERECGVRIALGAGPWNLVSELVREVAPLLGIGTLTGLLASLASRGVIRAYVVSGPTDARTWLLVGLVLLAAVCVAAAGPLLRIRRIHPVILLRSQ